MDRLVYYKKILEKNPAYNKALSDCMEELRGDPLLSKSVDNTDNVRVKGSIIHHLHSWAPVLTEFAAWVLDDAKKSSIKRLYFLSRDAWPVYRAALALADSSSPELRYLRVSRYALRIPEMAIDDSHFLDMMFLSGIDVTMRKILQRGALSEEEMLEFVSILGFSDSLDRIMGRPEILQWKAKAEIHKEELWTIVQRHARQRLPDAIGYFRQEGMLSGDSVAVVDSGWVGTTQRSIKRLLDFAKPGTELHGYYFGLYEIPKNMDPNTYKTFYFGPKGQIRRKVYFSNCLFEAVSSEAAGMTLRYENNNPVIADYGSLNSEYLETMQPYLEMFARAYACNRELDNGVSVSEDILSKLMARPDKWEAELYGTLKFCDDVLEGDAQDIAVRLPYTDICNLRLFRKTVIWLLSKLHIKTPDIHESGWIYGSIVRCGKHVWWSLLQARLYNYLMYVRKSMRYVKR